MLLRDPHFSTAGEGTEPWLVWYNHSWPLLGMYFKPLKITVFSETFKCYFGRGCMLQLEGMLRCEEVGIFCYCRSYPRWTLRLKEKEGREVSATLQAEGPAWRTCSPKASRGSKCSSWILGFICPPTPDGSCPGPFLLPMPCLVPLHQKHRTELSLANFSQWFYFNGLRLKRISLKIIVPFIDCSAWQTYLI